MINGLKPYPSMKESGVPWLGTVPAHWSVLPNRALFAEVKDRNHPDEEMLSVTITKGVVKQKELLANSAKKDSSNLDRSAYKLVQPRDIAYNKMRAWQGAIGVSNYRGIVSPAYVIMRLRGSANPRYFHHLYRTPQFAREAERWSYGITSDMWSLRPEHFRLIYSVLPPPEEQNAIVRFVEHVDGRLRSYISAKQRLVKLLEEQKQATVHRIVTRGLEVGVPLKPSGVDWLGQIPQHWQVRKIRHCGKFLGGMTPSMETPKYWDGTIPWVTPKDMKQMTISDSILRVKEVALKETGLKLIERSAVLIVVRGMILARRVPVAWTAVPVTVNQDMKAIVPDEQIEVSYLALAMNSAQSGFKPLIDEAGHGTRRLPTERLKEVFLPMPPPDEQKAIVTEISKRTETIDRSLQAAKRQSSLMDEYRVRTVSEAVRGKVDVREAANTLPSEAETSKHERSEDLESEELDQELETLPEEA